VVAGWPPGLNLLGRSGTLVLRVLGATEVTGGVLTFAIATLGLDVVGLGTIFAPMASGGAFDAPQFTFAPALGVPEALASEALAGSLLWVGFLDAHPEVCDLGDCENVFGFR
jgi:hypothetical protein